MIELELPCCGGTTKLLELADEIRCEGCDIVVELAPDPVVATLALTSPLTGAAALAA